MKPKVYLMKKAFLRFCVSFQLLVLGVHLQGQSQCQHLGQPVICPPGVAPGSTSLFFIGPPANNNIQWSDGSTTFGVNPQPFPADGANGGGEGEESLDVDFFQQNFFRNGQGEPVSPEQALANLLQYGLIVPVTPEQLERIKETLNSGFARAVSTSSHNRRMEQSYRESAEGYREAADGARDRARQWRELAENQDDPETKRRYEENAEQLEQDAQDLDARAEAEDQRADEYGEKANRAEAEAENYFDDAVKEVLEEDLEERQAREQALAEQVDETVSELGKGTTVADSSTPGSTDSAGSGQDESSGTTDSGTTGGTTPSSGQTPPPTREQTLEELRTDQWVSMQNTRANTIVAITELQSRLRALEREYRQGRSHLAGRIEDTRRLIAGRTASLEYIEGRITTFQDTHFDGKAPPGAVNPGGTITPADQAEQASMDQIQSNNLQDVVAGNLIDAGADYAVSRVGGAGAGYGSISPGSIKTIYDLGQSAQQVANEAPAMNQAIIDAMNAGDFERVRQLKNNSFRRAVRTMFNSSGVKGYGDMVVDFTTGGN